MTSKATQPLSEEDREVGKLLNPEERAGCQILAAGETPHNQHAQALLALDEGVTQGEAGQRAGLTKGQVRYWLGKFRKDRMAIFPKSSKPEPAPQTPEEAAQVRDAIVDPAGVVKEDQPEIADSAIELTVTKKKSKKKRTSQKMDEKKGRAKKKAKGKAGKKSQKREKGSKGKGDKKGRKKSKSKKVKSGKKRKKAKKASGSKKGKKKGGKKQTGKKVKKKNK